MLRKTFPLFLTALLLALSATYALAAPAASFRIRADIDFDFYVGNKRLAKGEYTIESVNGTSLVRISSVKKGKSVSVLTIRGKMTNKPKTKLGFKRYGDQYFLRKVWDGQNDVLEIERSKTEKKAAKALKGNEDDEGEEVDKG